MCKLKSGIVLRDESLKGGFKLIMSPWTESHSDLIQMHNLRDDSRLRFARVEFSPPTMAEADKVDLYKLRIDEKRTPEWFDDEMKEAVSGRMRDYIRSIIVSDARCLLIGGQFILAAGASVQVGKCCVINAVLSGGTVQHVSSGGTVQNVWSGGTVKNVWSGGTVQNVLSGGTVQNVWSGGTVQNVEDGASINGEKKGVK